MAEERRARARLRRLDVDALFENIVRYLYYAGSSDIGKEVLGLCLSLLAARPQTGNWNILQESTGYCRGR